MTFGVTLEGFNAKRTADVLTEIQDDLRPVLGDSVDLDAEQPIGQIISILSDRIGNLWELAEQVYNSQYPTSEGASLDNVASITGSVRDGASSSRVVLTLFGVVDTLIEAGKIVSVAGNIDAKFATNANATIAAGINAEQQITIPTLPETGTFTLEFLGSITAPLNYNDTAATIQAALEALLTIGAGNVSVVGDVQDGLIYITLQNDLGSAPQPAITINSSTLTSAEKTQVITIADVAGNLDRTAFLTYDQNGSVAVWFDIDNSGSAPPASALAADRHFEIIGVATNDSANSIAATVASELNADPEFSVSVVGNVISITSVVQGDRPDAIDVDTFFTISTTKQGYNAGILPLNISTSINGVLPQTNVDATAIEVGPVKAPSGTLTVIETPVTGWTSVTNPLDEITGALIESDPDFRLKRINEIATAGRATIDAIRARVLKVTNVREAFVFENDTDIVDVDGRPPNSLDIVVQDGDDQEIADAIFDSKSGGIQTIGDVTKIVTDSQGFSKTIKFSRPTIIPIFVELDLTINANFYPADGDTQVKNALVLWGDGLGIGTSVIVHGSNSLESSFGNIPGITDIVIRVGKAAFPTLDDNIVIAAREIPDFDTSRIVIVKV